MYKYYTEDIFTVCQLIPDEGPYFEAQVITTEYKSDDLARAAAKKIADSMYSLSVVTSQSDI